MSRRVGMSIPAWLRRFTRQPPRLSLFRPPSAAPGLAGPLLPPTAVLSPALAGVRPAARRLRPVLAAALLGLPLLAVLAAGSPAQGATVSVSVTGDNIPENGTSSSAFEVSVSPAQSVAVPIRMCLTSSESSLDGITVRQGKPGAGLDQRVHHGKRACGR